MSFKCIPLLFRHYQKKKIRFKYLYIFSSWIVNSKIILCICVWFEYIVHNHKNHCHVLTTSSCRKKCVTSGFLLPFEMPILLLLKVMFTCVSCAHIFIALHKHIVYKFIFREYEIGVRCMYRGVDRYSLCLLDSIQSPI